MVIPDATFISTFSGSILAEGAGALQSTPAAVPVEGHLFRIDHVALNAADGATATLENGFKLDYAQLPCSGASTSVTV